MSISALKLYIYNMRKIYPGLIAIIFFLVIGSLLFVYREANPNAPTPSPEAYSMPKVDVDRRAGFAIFTNGVFRDFSNNKYHNLNSQVFITSGNPNIVVVKRSGITWDDFFKTLPMEITTDCLSTGTGQQFCSRENQTLKFFLNGIKDENLLSREIQDGDRVLISYGPENAEGLFEQLARLDKINEAEDAN